MPANDLYRKQLDGLLDELHRYAKQHDVGIVHAWHFRRVVYDMAVGGAWEQKVKRPFLEHASPTQLGAALDAARQLIDAPDLIAGNLENSLFWRGLASF